MDNIVIRNATANDGAIMRKLAHECGTLDLHTPYTYWVAAAHYSGGCFIMEEDGTPIGYIMAVDAPEIVFIWQIGILPEHRGKGLSRILIASCVGYAKERKKDIEVTIAENNENSYRSFARFCEKKWHRHGKNGNRRHRRSVGHNLYRKRKPLLNQSDGINAVSKSPSIRLFRSLIADNRQTPNEKNSCSFYGHP